MSITIDYRQTSCNSLGNIVAQAMSAQVIKNHIDSEMSVVTGPYHMGVWPLYLSRSKVLPGPPENKTMHVASSAYDIATSYGLSWLEVCLYESTRRTPMFWDSNWNALFPLFCQRESWSCDPSSRTVMIYPKEHDNKNVVFGIDWWERACRRLLFVGYKIAAVLQDEPSERDVNGIDTAAWTREFKRRIPCSWVFPSTIGGIQAACGVSSLAIGRFTGPGWLLLRSSIRQIGLDSASDRPTSKIGYHVSRNLFSKKIEVFEGDGFEWVNSI